MKSAWITRTEGCIVLYTPAYDHDDDGDDDDDDDDAYGAEEDDDCAVTDNGHNNSKQPQQQNKKEKEKRMSCLRDSVLYGGNRPPKQILCCTNGVKMSTRPAEAPGPATACCCLSACVMYPCPLKASEHCIFLYHITWLDLTDLFDFFTLFYGMTMFICEALWVCLVYEKVQYK